MSFALCNLQRCLCLFALLCVYFVILFCFFCCVFLKKLLFQASRGARVVVNDLGGSFKGEGASTRAADLVVQEIIAAVRFFFLSFLYCLPFL